MFASGKGFANQAGMTIVARRNENNVHLRIIENDAIVGRHFFEMEFVCGMWRA